MYLVRAPMKPSAEFYLGEKQTTLLREMINTTKPVILKEQ